MVARFIMVDGGWVYGCDCGSKAYENRYLHSKPNTKNNFLTNFSQHRTTIENIFLFVKYFHFKIFYTHKIFYLLPNAALLTGLNKN